MKRFVSFFVKLVSSPFWSVFEFFYLIINPLESSVKKELKNRCLDYRKRKRELNSIRVRNIKTTFWANTGTFFQLFLGLLAIGIGFFERILLLFQKSIGKLHLPGSANLLKDNPNFGFFTALFIFIFGTVLLILITTQILKNIVKKLPPKQYAEISLSNLSESEILTLVAYRMYLLCNRLVHEYPIPDSFSVLIDSNTGKFDVNRFNQASLGEKSEIREAAEKMDKTIIKFRATYYDELLKCVELKHEAVRKLKILEREFCHHILKFSPLIFETRINSLKSNIDSITFIINPENEVGKENKFAIQDSILDIVSIYNDIQRERMRNLGQLIAYRDTHDYIIGLSSVTSTSQSLKVFTRGISDLTRKLRGKGLGDNAQEKITREIEAFLHRSKAHYGMDLMVSLENFYRRNYTQSQPEYKIPEYLYKIKFEKNRKLLIDYDIRSLFRKIRIHLLEHYEPSMNVIKQEFKNHFDKVHPTKDGKIYFLVFGYSKVIRNVFREYSEQIQDRAEIFIMKEDGTTMLDTRKFRFELNDSKPNNNIRRTFTASDDFFYNMLNENDTLIMIAGAEAYCAKNKLLLHTNNYQQKVESMISRLQNARNLKPSPQIWILAGDYKIYKNFPEDESRIFGGEFFSDHYDKVDLYDFSGFKDENLKIITNKPLPLTDDNK